MGHKNLMSDHLLVGFILEGEGTAAITLANLGVDLERIRKAILVVARQSEPISAKDRLPLHGGVEELIESARDDAMARGHRLTGTGHLLYWMCNRPTDMAYVILDFLGVKPHDLQYATAKQMELTHALESEHPTVG